MKKCEPKVHDMYKEGCVEFNIMSKNSTKHKSFYRIFNILFETNLQNNKFNST